MNLKFVAKAMAFYLVMFSIALVVSVSTSYIFTGDPRLSIVNGVLNSCVMTPFFLTLLLWMDYTSISKFIK
jgi:uncharacterized membrane protein